MGGKASKRYRSLSDLEKFLKPTPEPTNESASDCKVITLFRRCVFAPFEDNVKASARFEVKKITERRLRELKKEFMTSTEGDRVLLSCRDGAIAPHKEILRCAWAGFISIDHSTLRTNFRKYSLLDMKNLLLYIYSNILPDDYNELLSLLTASHRLGYSSLSESGARKLVDFCVELDPANVNALIQVARRFELKSLYNRLCVVLARNFQHKQLMYCLDKSILEDVLNQHCLAVFSEDEVWQFVKEFAARGGGQISSYLIKCVRIEHLNDVQENLLTMMNFFRGSQGSCRTSFIEVLASFRYKKNTLTAKFKIRLTSEDRRHKELCSFKQYHNNLQLSRSHFEFPVCVASCKASYFMLLGESVVQIDPFGHTCEVICQNVVTLTVSESLRRVEVLTKFSQRIILSTGPSALLQSFRVRTPCNKIDLSVIAHSETEGPLGEEYFLPTSSNLHEKLMLQ